MHVIQRNKHYERYTCSYGRQYRMTETWNLSCLFHNSCFFVFLEICLTLIQDSILIEKCGITLQLRKKRKRNATNVCKHSTYLHQQSIFFSYRTRSTAPSLSREFWPRLFITISNKIAHEPFFKRQYQENTTDNPIYTFRCTIATIFQMLGNN